MTIALFSEWLWTNCYSKTDGDNMATLSEVRKSNLVLQDLPRNQTTRNPHKQMVVDSKSHQNKLGDHELQNCRDGGIKFSGAQLLKVSRIAPFKGQVLRLSKTGPLLSTYKSI